MYIVMMIILTFFAVIGITHFITAIIDAIFYRDDGTSYLLIVPDPTDNNAEGRLRAALSRLRGVYNGQVIAICDADGGELLQILEYLRQDYPTVEVMSRTEYVKKIMSGSS